MIGLILILLPHGAPSPHRAKPSPWGTKHALGRKEACSSSLPADRCQNIEPNAARRHSRILELCFVDAVTSYQFPPVLFVSFYLCSPPPQPLGLRSLLTRLVLLAPSSRLVSLSD